MNYRMNSQDIETLAAELREWAQQYHDGDIDHAKFQAMNRATWNTAEMLGVQDDVVKIVSRR